MKDSLFKKILYKNIILCLLGLIFIIGICMLFLYHFTYTNIYNDNQRVANIISLRIDNYMNLAIKRALFISKDKNLLEGDYSSIIKNDFEVASVYDAIVVINNKGEVIGNYPHKETFNKKEIRRLINRDFSYSLQSFNKHIVILTPVKDSKSNNKLFLAFFIEREKSKFFNNLLYQTKDEFGGKAYIVDNKGQIIFDNDKSKLNQYIPLNKLNTSLNKVHEDIKNPYITTKAKVPITEWYIIVETPSRNVLTPLYQIALIILLIFVCLFIVYTILTFYTLKSTFKPIKDLISEMMVFSRLDYYQPLTVKGVGEIVHLYEAFNIMINRLKRAWEQEQETFEELKRAEKLSIVGELAAGSAHEIRNPLTTIKGFIQLFYENGKPITSEHKDLIFSELEHIEQITNEFLMLSKPQMNVYQPIKIQDLIDNICQKIDDDAKFNNIKLDNKVNSSDEIYCDPSQIKQVFLNISRNAIQAMSKSGGSLTIDYKVDELNQGCYITFTDTGPGIPKEHLDKLVHPFFTTKSNNTGLGLTVTYRIIQNHQGNIYIDTSDKGTTFIIWLPYNGLQAVN